MSVGYVCFFTKNKFLTKKKYLFIARFCRTSGLGCQAYMWGIFIFLFFYCFFFFVSLERVVWAARHTCGVCFFFHFFF